jgi:putative membrane protein
MGPPMPFGVHGHRGFGDSFSAMPFIGAAVLVALLVVLGTALYRAHQQRSMPALTAAVTPDDEARRILAERFARSEISSDEFLERASILNWTPGSDQFKSTARKTQR